MRQARVKGRQSGVAPRLALVKTRSALLAERLAGGLGAWGWRNAAAAACGGAQRGGPTAGLRAPQQIAALHLHQVVQRGCPNAHHRGWPACGLGTAGAAFDLALPRVLSAVK